MRHQPPSHVPRTAPPAAALSAFLCAAVSAVLCAACAMPPSKEEQEAAKNTFACLYAGERVVIRFDVGEARLLMADGNRVALYQIPAASGVRFSNGVMELRGKGTDLHLMNNGVETALKDCQPFAAPT
jgi:membrane-bound inhibitor of C-type lysozyme